jgi:hypothetical protein
MLSTESIQGPILVELEFVGSQSKSSRKRAVCVQIFEIIWNTNLLMEVGLARVTSTNSLHVLVRTLYNAQGMLLRVGLLDGINGFVLWQNDPSVPSDREITQKVS